MHKLSNCRHFCGGGHELLEKIKLAALWPPPHHHHQNLHSEHTRSNPLHICTQYFVAVLRAPPSTTRDVLIFIGFHCFLLISIVFSLLVIVRVGKNACFLSSLALDSCRFRPPPN